MTGRQAGQKVGLTLRDVVGAAAEIADARGWEAVSLASVAERLGIRSPSLYAHVEGLPGLRRELALHAAGEMAPALRAARGRRKGVEALRAMLRAYRRFARLHPGLYAAAQAAVRQEEDPELYRALAEVVVPVVEVLREAGVAASERIHLTRALRSALHGFVVLEHLGGFGMPESVDESFERMLDLMIAGVRASAG
jgi:AcrR family transcriptional regulator